MNSANRGCLAHGYYKSHSDINQENGSESQKSIETTEIVLSDALWSPWAMMIITQNAQVAISAMVTWTGDVKATFLTKFWGFFRIWILVIYKLNFVIIFFLKGDSRVAYRHH